MFREFVIFNTKKKAFINLNEVLYFIPDSQNENCTTLIFSNAAALVVKESYNQIKEIIKNE